jgi:hypothetical protein
MQILRPKREKEMSRDTPDRRNMLQLLMNPGLLVVAIFLRPMTEETERQKKTFEYRYS